VKVLYTFFVPMVILVGRWAFIVGTEMIYSPRALSVAATAGPEASAGPTPANGRIERIFLFSLKRKFIL